MNNSDKRIPKYIRIADSLKSDIARGTLLPGDQLPSFAEMMQQFKVAKHTIAKAHEILEHEGLVRREQGRGIFVEVPATKRTGNIGLLMRGTTQYNSYTRELIVGIQKQAREHNLGVMLVDEETPLTNHIDGILLFCNSLEVAVLNLPAKLPRVLLLEPSTSIEIANVVADDFSGAKMATRYLLEQGHRRISLMMIGDYDPYSLQRQAGYRAALDEFQVPFDEQLCFYLNKVPAHMENFMYGEEYMNLWLERGWEKLNATAVMAPNDAGAFGIIKALNSKNIKTPQDVSVTGFDGVGLGQQEESPLTTVQVPLREIGVCGVQLLWKQIENGTHLSQKVVLPVQLKTGNSTMPIQTKAVVGHD